MKTAAETKLPGLSQGKRVTSIWTQFSKPSHPRFLCIVPSTDAHTHQHHQLSNSLLAWSSSLSSPHPCYSYSKPPILFQCPPKFKMVARKNYSSWIILRVLKKERKKVWTMLTERAITKVKKESAKDAGYSFLNELEKIIWRYSNSPLLFFTAHLYLNRWNNEGEEQRSF